MFMATKHLRREAFDVPDKDALQQRLTQNPGQQTQDDGEGHKGPVPGVRPGHRRHAQEDEDQGLAHAAPHLQEVFDGGVGLVGDVGLHIGPHDHAARYEPDNKHKQGVT